MSEKIGSKIKQLREAAGLTQDDLAEAASIQTSKVALIESGEASPTIAILLKMARRLGVRLGTILDGTEATGPIVTGTKQLVSTVNTQRAGETEHLSFFSLAGYKSDRAMEPFIVTVKYTEPAKENFSTHEGEEFIYVLEGTIDVYYGREKLTVGEGETIYYDSIVPHCVTTPDKDATAKLLAVTYTPY